MTLDDLDDARENMFSALETHKGADAREVTLTATISAITAFSNVVSSLSRSGTIGALTDLNNDAFSNADVQTIERREFVRDVIFLDKPPADGDAPDL